VPDLPDDNVAEHAPRLAVKLHQLICSIGNKSSAVMLMVIPGNIMSVEKADAGSR
jgi:hypothetical protein